MQAIVLCLDCGHSWASDGEIRAGSCLCEPGDVMNWQLTLTSSSFDLQIPSNWEEAW